MNNIHPSQNKNTGAQPHTGKTCVRRGINGSIRKYKFVFRRSYTARLCFPCIESLGGSANALVWLEQNAIFDSCGGVPFIPFKKSATGKPKGKNHVWRKMFHYFQMNQEEFLNHYHARSNAESTMNMLKAKFGDFVRSKNWIAQQNEMLVKILCHNIVVVIHEIFELGINPNFGGEKNCS